MQLTNVVTIDQPGHTAHGRTGLVVGLLLQGERQVAHVKIDGGLTVAVPVDALRSVDQQPEPPQPDAGMVGRDHPATAHDAAHSVPIASHRRTVLRALASAPTGLTADELEAVSINPAELRVDTYRASGAGGQHVNKTDSAIRLTHLPTGIVVECQDERSQHKNRARAMALLQARLYAAERDRRAAEEAATRKGLIGSGDRSERIRTYNFPQGRVTDHRINLTLYRLQDVLDGGLDALVDPLVAEHQAEQLAALGG